MQKCLAVFIGACTLLGGMSLRAEAAVVGSFKDTIQDTPTEGVGGVAAMKTISVSWKAMSLVSMSADEVVSSVYFVGFSTVEGADHSDLYFDAEFYRGR